MGEAAHAELRSAVTRVGQRVDQMIVAAERAAADMRREAEAEAEAIRAQARLEAERRTADRNRGILDAIGALRLGLDRIEAEATRAISSVEEVLDSEARKARGAEAPPSRDPAPPAPRPQGDDPAAAVPRESVMIRATQLAIEGKDRSEMEGALRREFSLDDPAAIVEEILSRR